MEKSRVKCFVIIPCELDKNGKVVDSPTVIPPYGYHHIRKVYEDNTSWLSATVGCEVKLSKVLDIARIIAGELPVRVDEDFRL